MVFLHVVVSGVAHIFLHFSTRIYSSKGVLIHIAGEDKQSLLGVDKSLPTQDFTPTDFQQDVRVITSPIVVDNAFSNKGLNYVFYEVGDFRSLEIFPNPYFTIDSFYQQPAMRRVNIDYNINIDQKKDSVRLDYIYQGKSWGGFLKPGKPFADENIYLAISNLDQLLLEGGAENQKNILFKVKTNEALADAMCAWHGCSTSGGGVSVGAAAVGDDVASLGAIVARRSSVAKYGRAVLPTTSTSAGLPLP